MKNMFIVCFIVFGCMAKAQTEKQKILIDANSNMLFLNKVTNPLPNLEVDYDFTVDLQGGYAVIDNLFLGPRIQYNSLKYKNVDLRISDMYYGAFAKYFFNHYEKPFVIPYIYSSYSFGNTRLIYDLPDQDTFVPIEINGVVFNESTTSNRFELGAGLSLFVISEKLSVDLNLGYVRFGGEQFSLFNSNYVKSVIYFNAGFSLFL